MAAQLAIEGQQTQNRTLAFDFVLADGSPISIASYELNASKYEAAKHQLLQDFLSTAQQQLGFHAVTGHASSIWNKKKTWFSRIQNAGSEHL